MTGSNLANLLIGVVALGFILYRQLRARPAKTDVRLPLILAVIGIIQLSQYLHGHGHDPAAVFSSLTGSLLLAAAFGGVRAATVHVWLDGDQVWRRGNWLTALLWIVSLAVHLGYDYLVGGRGAEAGLGNATLLLYFAVTYTIQRFIIQARAKWIASAQQADPEAHITVRWP
jgi:hypothetical protein